MNTTYNITKLQVMEQWINALDKSRSYTIKEEFLDGHIATHWNTMDSDVFTYQELDNYIHGIWLEDHPAELIICPA